VNNLSGILASFQYNFKKCSIYKYRFLTVRQTVNDAFRALVATTARHYEL